MQKKQLATMCSPAYTKHYMNWIASQLPARCIDKKGRMIRLVKTGKHGMYGTKRGVVLILGRTKSHKKVLVDASTIVKFEFK